ncbi:hypothetical protein DsansV1_C11g0114071 [Dioscorea sansibarensis]
MTWDFPYGCVCTFWTVLRKNFKYQNGTWVVTRQVHAVYYSSRFSTSFQQPENHISSHRPVWLSQAPSWLSTWPCGVPMTLYK